MKNYNLTLQEEVWGLAPFKKLLTRDKTKGKEVAHAEMLFIYFFCDAKSDYLVMNEEDRLSELKKDIAGLPKKWEPDADVKAAIDFYLKHETVIEKLYKSSVKSATDVSEYLENTDKLLKERNSQGNPVTDVAKIANTLSKIPKIMSDLKASYKELVKEQESLEGKKKGSREFNLYEDGL